MGHKNSGELGCGIVQSIGPAGVIQPELY